MNNITYLQRFTRWR